MVNPGPNRYNGRLSRCAMPLAPAAPAGSFSASPSSQGASLGEQSSGSTVVFADVEDDPWAMGLLSVGCGQ